MKEKIGQPVIALDERTRALRVVKLLGKVHPDASIALKFRNNLELLISVILSAQCTDRMVNKVTKRLFKKYRTVEDYAEADLRDLQREIKSTGFYRNKARNVKRCCRMLREKFGSRVPRTMEDLLELPGVGRKTANVVLANAFGVVEGIAVDTHVGRVSRRLGLTGSENPAIIEKDLMKTVPKDHWERITDLLIFHGRRICTAKRPKCSGCVLNKICPSAFTFG